MEKCIEEIKKFVGGKKSSEEMVECSLFINEMLEKDSIARTMCDTSPNKEFKLEMSPPENQFPEAPCWVLPSLGYMAQDYYEAMANEVWVPAFSVQAYKHWNVRYNKENRFDVWIQALKSISRAVGNFEEESLFKLLTPACTTHFTGNVLSGGKEFLAPIAETNPPSKTCNLALIKHMASVMLTRGETLDKLWLSPEDIHDLHESGELKRPDYRGDIWFIPKVFLSFTLGDQEFNVEIVGMNSLGCRGKYNINDKNSKYGPFIGNAENKFNDYQITNGNVMDENGNVTKAGETQIYGFSKSVKDYLKMPVVEPFTTHWDFQGGKTGIFGWQKYGNVCLNNKCLVMGVIDRNE